MFWTFENGSVKFFANFWVMKLKSFSGKLRQNAQIYLIQNLGTITFLENGFGGILSSKTNVLNVWKGHFSVFCWFFSDEVEIILWEREAKRSKLFKSKFGHRKLIRKLFWSYLELKNKCSECLKRVFFSFLQVYDGQSWKHFMRKLGKGCRIIAIKIWE